MVISFKSLSKVIVLTCILKVIKALHTSLELFSSAKINQKSYDVFPWEAVEGAYSVSSCVGQQLTRDMFGNDGKLKLNMELCIELSVLRLIEKAVEKNIYNY